MDHLVDRIIRIPPPPSPPLHTLYIPVLRDPRFCPLFWEWKFSTRRRKGDREVVIYIFQSTGLGPVSMLVESRVEKCFYFIALEGGKEEGVPPSLTLVDVGFMPPRQFPRIVSPRQTEENQFPSTVCVSSRVEIFPASIWISRRLSILFTSLSPFVSLSVSMNLIYVPRELLEVG